MRNFFGICFFIVSGFLFYTAGLVAFISNLAVRTDKMLILLILSIIAFLFLLIGLWIHPGKRWKIPTGITLVSGGAVNILVICVFFSMKYSPEIYSEVDISPLELFGDYATGLIAIFLVMSTGLYCLISADPSE